MNIKNLLILCTLLYNTSVIYSVITSEIERPNIISNKIEHYQEPNNFDAYSINSNEIIAYFFTDGTYKGQYKLTDNRPSTAKQQTKLDAEEVYNFLKDSYQHPNKARVTELIYTLDLGRPLVTSEYEPSQK